MFFIIVLGIVSSRRKCVVTARRKGILSTLREVCFRLETVISAGDARDFRDCLGSKAVQPSTSGIRARGRECIDWGSSLVTTRYRLAWEGSASSNVLRDGRAGLVSGLLDGSMRGGRSRPLSLMSLFRDPASAARVGHLLSHILQFSSRQVENHNFLVHKFSSHPLLARNVATHARALP